MVARFGCFTAVGWWAIILVAQAVITHHSVWEVVVTAHLGQVSFKHRPHRRPTLGRPIMSSITEAAQAFFDACDAGKGWEVCSAYCTPDATFTAQAEPLMEVKTLQQ